MLLYLIRHGQTDSNVTHYLDTVHPGAPLDATGRAQAEALADRLGSEPIEAVYASDLTRAVQTATPLARRLGVGVVELPGLREIPAGVEEGNTDWASYLAALVQWGRDPDSRLEGGESAVEFLTRFDGAIAEIAGAGHAVAALVSHGAALRVWTPLRASNLITGSGSDKHLGNTEVIVLKGDPEAGWTALSWAGEQLA